MFCKLTSLAFVCSAIVLIAASCQGNQKQNVNMVQGIPTFDFQAEYPVKELAFQDVADVEYIPLETTDSSLISGVLYLFVSDNEIITHNYQTESVIIFDRTGKYKSSFSRKGGSEKEYAYLSDMTVDFDAKEIYIFDYRGLSFNKVKVYSFEGDYLRSLPTADSLRLEIMDYDTNNLFAEDKAFTDFDMDFPHVFKPSQEPYYLISKQTGEMRPLHLHVNDRLRNQINETTMLEPDYSQTVSINIPIYPVSKSGKDIFVADFGLDTIYSLQAGQWTPVAAKVNRQTSHGSVIMTEVCMQSEKYLLLKTFDKRLLTKNPPTGPDPVFYLYDKASGKIEIVEFFNCDGISYKDLLSLNAAVLPRSSYSILPANTMRFCYSSSYLLEKLEKGELKGKLKEVAEKLDVEDNPVLVLVKFKE